ncbi:Malate/lactate/ureidoglycolate dehydrogenase, LDH2 family [Cyclobacterium xiamenense]|uniref:Malate/lactate/ureidoglycolate dehydrogenase, LDH2 family n=1 Tax=Cyclobacterium xiamenense TaxID=1297121 RepID=A0A1H7AQV8_9BACT|nr:Ldh family oxidoreductase [Cyclobacterium xiamenense]SEJ68031.1 Malate/lactate/ureidoglycolate dehydrogenase, LDH2 family [Cyclobacterium xiamenense]
MNFSFAQLENFTIHILQKIGCSEEDARTAARVLLAADVRGVDSHGVARLSGYVRLWEADRINARPNLRIVHETPSTAVVDGDGGLGLVVAPFAMQVAIDKAKKAGTGWVSVKHSNHYGIAGIHAMEALKHDMIGISLTNASPLVSPTFSRERMLGTNPIAVAIPANKQPPFVLDMATTTAANGKLEILQRKQQEAPLGWIQDRDGNPTTSPLGVKDGGALLPLGGDREHGSHKGYGLGSVVDIFSAVLSGANYGPWVPPFVAFLEPHPHPVGEGLGHFFGAMRIDAFRPADEFKTHMDQWIGRFREALPVAGQEKVLIPGDPERELEAQRMQEGIPLLEPVIADLKALGKKFDVEWIA